MFSEFNHELLSERSRAGLIEARRKGTGLGRRLIAAIKAVQVRKLYRASISKAEIARRLNLGRISVRRLLANL